MSMSNNINELDFASDFRKATIMEETPLRRLNEKNSELIVSSKNDSLLQDTRSPSTATVMMMTPNELLMKNISKYRNEIVGRKEKEKEKEKEEEIQKKKIMEFNPEVEQQREKEEEEEEWSTAMMAVAWKDEVDRFSNFVTKKNMTHLELHAIVEEILKDFQAKKQSVDDKHNNDNDNDVDKKSDGENSTFSSFSLLSSLSSSLPMSKDILTYMPYKNWFLCKISSGNDNEEEERMSEFSIGIYTYQEGKCLLDIQKLSGEHFTFTHFFEHLKTILRERDVINTPVIKKEIMNAYGLDIDIGLEMFN